MNDLITSKMSRGYALMAECRDAPAAKKIVDMANAAKIYAKRQNLGRDTIDAAHALMAESQKLLGEFLILAEKNPGIKMNGSVKGRIGGNTIEPPIALPTLAESGITKRESSECQRIARVAKTKPELFDAYRSNERRLSDFRREEKKQEHKQRIELAKIDPPRIIEKGPFDLVVADPPWRYEHCETDSREIENHYPTAPLEEILKHSPNSKPDSILFLWVTAPLLESGLQVMKAWGFSYRSCAVWDKQKIGMGYWWRIQHELLFVGVKGNAKCTPECERVSSIFSEPRTAHSVKPESVLKWIERAFPDSSKLEMYQRKPRPGWAGWGNEC